MMNHLSKVKWKKRLGEKQVNAASEDKGDIKSDVKSDVNDNRTHQDDNHALLVQDLDGKMATAGDEKERGDNNALVTKISNRYRKTYRKKLIYTITFIVHFVMVLGILTGGAVVFAYLEDREYLVDGTNATNFLRTISNSSRDEEYSRRLLWDDVETKFNISVDKNIQEPLIQHFRDYIASERRLQEELLKRRQHSDKMFIFKKWLYFVTIATTTIGYGDISPKTDDGKLFYIFFSIIGIILMMTLLRRCGTIISAANKMLYQLIDTYLCRRKTGDDNTDETMSALLSFFTTLLVFGCYFFAGFWYGKENLRNNWSLLEQFYFWIVTLTTVGLGDLTLAIDEEVDNMSFYLLYRVFGLAILAAIIDALQVVVKEFEKKRENLKRRLTRISRIQNPISKSRRLHNDENL